MVNPNDLDHVKSSMVCGQCHGIYWISNAREYYSGGFRFQPGEVLNQNKKPIIPTKLEEQPWLKAPLEKAPTFLSDRFWSDGMVRVTGREYNGLIESPCYQSGTLSCLSCHQMHHDKPQSEDMELWLTDQMKEGGYSNEACYQCHESFRDQLTQHTYHAPESPGSSCYNCHMPHTTYGLLKAVRSHEISSPD